jgi:ankyrin repeat protein
MQQHTSHKAIVQQLITHGVNVDIKARDGSSPLHFTSWNGQMNTVQLLIEHGADVTLKDKNGRSPLHDAAKQGHKAVAEELMKNGSEVHVTIFYIRIHPCA